MGEPEPTIIHIQYSIIMCQLIFCFLQLSKLRTDLKDAMFSSRLKSESFLSAKAYRSEERQEPAVNRWVQSLVVPSVLKGVILQYRLTVTSPI